MSNLMNILRILLQQSIDKIDSGNCFLAEDEANVLIQMLGNALNPDEYYDKYVCSKYLGVSIKTFEVLVERNNIQKYKVASNRKILFKKSDVIELSKTTGKLNSHSWTLGQIGKPIKLNINNYGKIEKI